MPSDPSDERAPTAPPGPTGPAPGGDLVVLDRVSHSFGPVEALHDLSFRVPQGRITVLLGPNGAGKTTAIRVVTGAIAPNVGTVRTFGLDPDEDGHLVRPRCGVVSAKPALYDRLTGRENLEYSAALYGVEDRSGARIDEAAERFGISDAMEALVGGYSTGMKTRLALARSVLHRPELLLFDEPTSGLDPESSYAVLDLIREMTSDGHTVVMCTHLLAEAEGLADHVVVVEGGTDLVSGSPLDLTRRYWPHPIVTLDAEDPRLLDRVSSWPGVAGYRRDPGGVRIELDDLRRLPDMVASLVADGVRLTRVEPHEPTLEDLYFTIRRQSGAGLLRPHDGGPIDGAADDDGVVARAEAPAATRRGLPTIRTGHGDLPAVGTLPQAAPRGMDPRDPVPADQGGNR
jgi:ABC-2 type transport system ATP-binding protein